LVKNIIGKRERLPDKANQAPAICSDINIIFHLTIIGDCIMSTNGNELKKGTEVIPRSSTGSLFSFDEFDNFFDEFLSRRWPRLLD